MRQFRQRHTDRAHTKVNGKNSVNLTTECTEALAGLDDEVAEVARRAGGSNDVAEEVLDLIGPAAAPETTIAATEGLPEHGAG